MIERRNYTKGTHLDRWRVLRRSWRRWLGPFPPQESDQTDPQVPARPRGSSGATEASERRLKQLNAVLRDSSDAGRSLRCRVVGFPRGGRCRDEAISPPKVAIDGAAAIRSRSRGRATVGAKVAVRVQSEARGMKRTGRTWMDGVWSEDRGGLELMRLVTRLMLERK